MKQAFILRRSVTYISNETLTPTELTEQERLMDGIFGEKYLFVELFEKVGKVTGKTFKELDLKVQAFCWQNNNWDVEVFVKK